MAGVGRIQAMLWSAVAVAVLCAGPVLADEAVADEEGAFAAWETVPEDDLNNQRGGEEIVVEGDLGLNIGITEGTITDTSIDNMITGHITNNPVTSNRGINFIDFNTGANVIIQKNANLIIHMP